MIEAFIIGVILIGQFIVTVLYLPIYLARGLWRIVTR